MTAIAIVAAISATILCLGLASFAMMFQDVAPSQNSYAWPYLISVGFVGLTIAGVAALVQVFA